MAIELTLPKCPSNVFISSPVCQFQILIVLSLLALKRVNPSVLSTIELTP